MSPTSSSNNSGNLLRIKRFVHGRSRAKFSRQRFFCKLAKSRGDRRAGCYSIPVFAISSSRVYKPRIGKDRHDYRHSFAVSDGHAR